MSETASQGFYYAALGSNSLHIELGTREQPLSLYERGTRTLNVLSACEDLAGGPEMPAEGRGPAPTEAWLTSPGPFPAAPEPQAHAGLPSLVGALPAGPPGVSTGVKGPPASLLSPGTLFLDTRQAALQAPTRRGPGEEHGERRQHLQDSPCHCRGHRLSRWHSETCTCAGS